MCSAAAFETAPELSYYQKGTWPEDSTEVKRYPLVEEIRTPFSAAEFFSLVHQEPFAFFLDSGMDPAKLGRYSFVGWDPFLVLKSRGDELTLLERRTGGDTKGQSLPRCWANCWRDTPSTPTGRLRRWSGGAVGYFSYDLCHFIENVPGKAMDDLQLPECCLGFYDVVITFDHLHQRPSSSPAASPNRTKARD